MHLPKARKLGVLRLATMVAALHVSSVCVPGIAFAAAPANHVKDVRVHAAPDLPGVTEIEVTGTDAPAYQVRSEAGGKRLILELGNSDVAGAPESLSDPGGLVSGILTQSFHTEVGMMTRLTIHLSKDATYRVRVDGSKLHVLFTPSSQGVVPNTDPAPRQAKSGASAELAEVKFERMPSTATVRGKDRVVITVSPMPAYALTTTPSGRIRLELKDTHVSDTLLRTLDVGAYKGFLRTVSTFIDVKAGSTIVEIDRLGDSQGDVTIDGDKLVWSFDLPKTNVSSPVNDPHAGRQVVTLQSDDPAANVPKVETSIHGNDDGSVTATAGGSEAGFTAGVAGQQTGRYSGRRIDLDLKDADIHNILRLLADVGKVNIVTADDVSGNITIRMRNVPWDQALDVVLQAKGLGMVWQGNLIRVAPIAVLQKERELRIAQAKAELDLAPLETRLIPVSYATADELQLRAKELLSPRGSIAVDERTNVLIARDVAGNLNHIEELVRSLDTQTPQVLVEARIVEATSRYIRDVGIQWGGDLTFSEATGNPTGIAFPSRVGVAGGNYDQQTPTAGLSPFQRQIATPNFAVNLPAAVGTGAGGALGLSFGSVDNNINLSVRLSAAESSGMVRIVSSPRILTLDNREARINQGTLIPFAQISAQGVQTTFQEAKLQLLVKPHVTADGSVAMHVRINRDEPDFNQTSARGDPTILKREAETDLLVMDGHTAVIGGIYTRNTGRNLDQVPFFGDIPILGVLFQRRRASDSRNELVIFLTPRIVNRAEALGR
jgi:type IV pilus assembly protein PilQ